MSARISVVIPTYNSLHLAECLDSVAKQRRTDVECLVVDDCSSAESYATIEATVAKYPFATLRRNTTRLGPKANFIHCLGTAGGEYIKVLQHDDILLDGALDTMVKALDETPDAVMATSPMRLIDGNGQHLPDQWWNAPIVTKDAVFDGRDLIAWTIQTQGNPIGAPAASLIRSTAIDLDLLEFATSEVERAFDVAAWMTIAPQGSVAYIATPLSCFRLHEASLSGQTDLGVHLAADWGTINLRAVQLGILAPGEAAIAWTKYLPRIINAADGKYGNAGNMELAEVIADRVALTSVALGGIELVCAVLCEGATGKTVNTARAALCFADQAIILDRKARAESTRDGVRIVPCNWEDQTELGSALGESTAVLMVEGERLEFASATHARSALATLGVGGGTVQIECGGVLDTRVITANGPDGTVEMPADILSITTTTNAARAKSSCPLCETSPATFTALANEYTTAPAAAGFEHPLDGWELLNVESYECARCRAADRDRAMWMYAKNAISGDVLDIAPSAALSPKLRAHHNVTSYRTADAYMSGVDDVVDIRALPYQDNSFDWVICSHVLEHVDDDSAALRELHRVVRPGGRALLLTPVSTHLGATIEDPTCVDEQERLRRFGQKDHVRIYTSDTLCARVESAGFTLHQVTSQMLGSEACNAAAVPATARLYVAEKGGGQ